MHSCGYISSNDYPCTKCHKVFVPFNVGHLCPSCGEPSEFGTEMISELVSSLIRNKQQSGRFTPDGAYYNRMTGNIQRVVYQVFDSIDARQISYTDEEFVGQIEEYFGAERGYIVPDVLRLLNELHELYLENDKFDIPYVPTPPRPANWFKSWLP